MHKSSKIFIAGHNGLVGKALVKRLQHLGYDNLLLRSRQEVDLCDSAQVKELFSQQRPEYVMLAAAKVGGIHANNTYPVDFLVQNSQIQLNVINAAYQYGIKRLLFLGSTCIYPRDCPQPIKEEYLLTGQLEPTNRPYALAKISGIELVDAYNRQHGTQYLAVMPTNLYGPGDNYDLQNSHVIPALIRKMVTAKINDAPSVEIWGTGQVRREFMHSQDLADACCMLMNLPDQQFGEIVQSYPPIINIGWGKDLTIKELVVLIANIVGYQGECVYNSAYPDGTPRKVLDTSCLNALGFVPKISLQVGLEQTIAQFSEEYSECV